jgi:hypothetical protein
MVVYLAGMNKGSGRKGQRKEWPRRPWPKGFSGRLRQAIETSIYRGNKTQLERDSGVRRATFYAWMDGEEAGREAIDALSLFAVADTLKKDPGWLLFGDGGFSEYRKKQLTALPSREVEHA